MVHRTQFKLISSFVGVSTLIGVLSLIAGWQLINNSVFNEAKNRISQDLNAAWEIYHHRQDSLLLSLKVTALDEYLKTTLKEGCTEVLMERLADVSGQVKLDFAGIVVNGESRGHSVASARMAAGRPKSSIPLPDWLLTAVRRYPGPLSYQRRFFQQRIPISRSGRK